MPVIRRNIWIPPDRLRTILSQLSDRDLWICTLALETGYRIDDIMTSRVQDWGPETVAIRESKTKKLRVVGLSHAAQSALRALIRATERERRRDGSDWLLPGLRGRPGDSGREHRSTIWRHWRRVVRALGYPDSYTLHSLRRCYAVGVFLRHHDISEVMHDLNHDRPSTTLLYLADALLAASPLLGGGEGTAGAS